MSISRNQSSSNLNDVSSAPTTKLSTLNPNILDKGHNKNAESNEEKLTYRIINAEAAKRRVARYERRRNEMRKFHEKNPDLNIKLKSKAIPKAPVELNEPINKCITEISEIKEIKDLNPIEENIALPQVLKDWEEIKEQYFPESHVNNSSNPNVLNEKNIANPKTPIPHTFLARHPWLHKLVDCILRVLCILPCFALFHPRGQTKVDNLTNTNSSSVNNSSGNFDKNKTTKMFNNNSTRLICSQLPASENPTTIDDRQNAFLTAGKNGSLQPTFNKKPFSPQELAAIEENSFKSNFIYVPSGSDSTSRLRERNVCRPLKR